jgi:peptidoglycan/LPS O-acetylase OafA/YrhL
MEDKGQSTSVMHGLQCVSALGLVFFHVHLLEGSHFFLSTDSCMLDKQHNHNLLLPMLPHMIGNLLFNISFQMTAFWLASGFFCEQQLSQQRLLHVLKVKKAEEEEAVVGAKDEGADTHDVRLGIYDNARVFFHYLLRRYPLVAILTVLMFLGKRQRRSDDFLPDELECSVPRLFKSLLLLVPVHEAEQCMGPGWAVVTEMHGCLALVLLSALVSNRHVRKRILVLAYIASVGLCWYTYQSLHSAHPAAIQRLTSTTVAELGYDHFAHYERQGQDFKAQFNLTTRLYSHVNFDEAGRWAVQTYRLAARRALYQTSIHKHGSSMLLGSLLCMNVKDRRRRQQQQQHTNHSAIVAFCKLVLALALLVVTKFLYFMTGTSLYLLADLLVSMRSPRRPFLDQKKQQRHSASFSSSSFSIPWTDNPLVWFFNPISSWITFLTPYTFGIYMVNLVVIMKRKEVIFQQRFHLLEQHQETSDLLCRDYDLSFLVRETIRAFISSLLVSMTLHHTLEWPFRRLLQQTPWLRTRHPHTHIRTTAPSSKNFHSRD